MTRKDETKERVPEEPRTKETVSWKTETIWFFHLFFKEIVSRSKVTPDHRIMTPDSAAIDFSRLYPGFEPHLTFDGPRRRCREELYLKVMSSDLRAEGVKVGQRTASFKRLAESTSEREAKVVLERTWRTFRDLMLTKLPEESHVCKQKKREAAM